MNEQQIKHIVEGALLAAGRSLTLDNLQALFAEDGQPEKGSLKKAVDLLREDYAGRSIEIKETGSGYRIQVKQEFAQWISKLWEERPTRYSRALLETLALIAYRQPITRGEIEEVRGVSVSTSIIRTLQDRDWVRVVGHRDVPGRPAMYGTTKNFLDYFSLKTLDELPTLAELRDIDSINVELDLDGEDDARGRRDTSDRDAADAGDESDEDRFVETEDNDEHGPDEQDPFDESRGVEVHADLGTDHDEDAESNDAVMAEEYADVPAEEEARTEEAGDEPARQEREGQQPGDEQDSDAAGQEARRAGEDGPAESEQSEDSAPGHVEESHADESSENERR